YSSHIRWRPSPSTLQPYSPLFRSVLVADALPPYFGVSSYTVGIGQSFAPAGWASIDTLCYARWDTSRPYEGPEVVEFSTPPAISVTIPQGWSTKPGGRIHLTLEAEVGATFEDGTDILSLTAP